VNSDLLDLTDEEAGAALVLINDGHSPLAAVLAVTAKRLGLGAKSLCERCEKPLSEEEAVATWDGRTFCDECFAEVEETLAEPLPVTPERRHETPEAARWA